MYFLVSILVALLPHWAASQPLLQPAGGITTGIGVRVASQADLQNAIRRGDENIIITDHIDLRMLPSSAGSSASMLVQTNFTISVRPLRRACRSPCLLVLLTGNRRLCMQSHTLRSKHRRSRRHGPHQCCALDRQDPSQREQTRGPISQHSGTCAQRPTADLASAIRYSDLRWGIRLADLSGA